MATSPIGSGYADSMPTDVETAGWHAECKIELFTVDEVAQADAWHRARARKHLRRAPHVRDHREVNGPELVEWKTASAPVLTHPDSIHADGNLLTRIGLARIGNLLIGTASYQALNVTHCRIGVGDSNTAAATTDTDLGAASGSGHRQYKLVDSVAQGTGASSGVTTIVATFATGQANFAWAEWGIDGGTADGTTVTSDAATTPGLINHKITSLLTKTSAVVAVFTATITIS